MVIVTGGTSCPTLLIMGMQNRRPMDPRSRTKDGLHAIARSLWFVLSLILYVVGVSLRLVGSVLVRLSGWENFSSIRSTPKVDS